MAAEAADCVAAVMPETIRPRSNSQNVPATPMIM